MTDKGDHKKKETDQQPLKRVNRLRVNIQARIKAAEEFEAEGYNRVGGS